MSFVDDRILIPKDPAVMDTFINSLETGPEKFKFTGEGTLSSYLGVEISRLPTIKGLPYHNNS